MKFEDLFKYNNERYFKDYDIERERERGFLANTDCLKFMKCLDDESVDLIVTDPPYKLTSRGGSGTMGGYWTGEKAKRGTVFTHNNISCKDYIPEFYRILKDKTLCYIMCNNVNLIEMLNVSQDCGFNFVKCIIWEKGNKICGRYYMGCFEYIVLLRKGGDRPINNCGTPDILKVPIKKLKDENKKNLHDTEKPVDLMKVIVENSSKENDTTFDPFVGIGASLLASKQLNRRYIGCELDPKYYDISVKRLKGEL